MKVLTWYAHSWQLTVRDERAISLNWHMRARTGLGFRRTLFTCTEVKRWQIFYLLLIFTQNIEHLFLEEIFKHEKLKLKEKFRNKYINRFNCATSLAVSIKPKISHGPLPRGILKRCWCAFLTKKYFCRFLDGIWKQSI